ncbi:MAG: glutamate--cysteine ligase [Paracoccaceae bacterium]
MSIPQQGGRPVESFADLVEWIEVGCKPPEDWRIGTEHEKFSYLTDTLMPIPYEGPRSVLAVLEGLRDRYAWAEVREEGRLIGLVKDGANISLEPGGQLELSGAPVETIHNTCDEVNDHLAQVKSICDPLGIGFLGLGAAPHWTHDDMPLMPKSRYALMDNWMPQVGTAGRDMMRRTCTVQVNLDFSSEADAVDKMRVALALQPVATALFANSPLWEGRPNGHASWRARCWRHLDDRRTGMLPFAFEDGFGFEAYADWALDVPMYFVVRDGKYVDALGQSFRDFLKGELPALPGERPTTADWADHLTTLFPEARLKRFIETRGADGGPWRRLCALPAFWVGLLYDRSALDAAWDLCKGWSAQQRDMLRVAASVDGLHAKVDGIDMTRLARDCVEIAARGLKARARPGSGGLVPDESHFLNALHDTLSSGETLSDEILRLWEGEWGRDIRPLFETRSY